MVSLKIGSRFEVEIVGLRSVWLKVGRWERYWNRLGLPDR